jgi:hypothetical protein
VWNEAQRTAGRRVAEEAEEAVDAHESPLRHGFLSGTVVVRES